MARIDRVIAPGLPHHITQQGNRRQQTFFREENYREYRVLMSEWCKCCHVEIWAYCLMPNHVHFIAVPASEDISEQEREVLRQYERNDRPLDSEHFVKTGEKRLGRRLQPQNRDRKREMAELSIVSSELN